jgi:hypothetical protein
MWLLYVFNAKRLLAFKVVVALCFGSNHFGSNHLILEVKRW